MLCNTAATEPEYTYADWRVFLVSKPTEEGQSYIIENNKEAEVEKDQVWS